MELAFFFLHISKAQCFALARTRTWIVQLGAQCTDHWTTEQSCGVGVLAIQLTTHVKSSILYGRTVKHPNFFRLDGLLLFCIIMGLRFASFAINGKLIRASCQFHFLILNKTCDLSNFGCVWVNKLLPFIECTMYEQPFCWIFSGC